jgi:hypothetical protein
MHFAWTCTHTYASLYAKFCLYIETTYIYRFQMRRKCIKVGGVLWLSSLCNVLMCFGCHHCVVFWYVFAVITMQHADVFRLLSLSWCFESFVPSTKYVISRMMEAAASSIHPPCHRQQDPLQVVHFYQSAHCTSLNTQSPHHTLVLNQVTRYPENWFVSWESLLCGFLSLLRQTLK